jgi:hypothetical protein
MTGQSGTEPSFRIVFVASGFAQSVPICGSSICIVKQRARFTRSESWTIEDEQCQKIDGGYEAVKFRSLLFLWMEPTFYLRQSTV